MNNQKVFTIFFSALLLVFSVTVGFAQQNFDSPNQTDNPNDRGRIIRALGLTQIQIRQIRTLRAERRPLLVAAQQRMRLAQRDLDQAIYADALDEAAIQIYLKEFVTAQAEMARIRAIDELEMRKILTPEQLTKFRQIREDVQQMRKNAQQRRQDRLQQQGDRPTNQPNRRPNLRQRP